MRRIEALIVAGAVLGLSLIGAAPRAEAMKCADELDEACRIVFTVVCEVVAKGEPCVM